MSMRMPTEMQQKVRIELSLEVPMEWQYIAEMHVHMPTTQVCLILMPGAQAQFFQVIAGIVNHVRWAVDPVRPCIEQT